MVEVLVEKKEAPPMCKKGPWPPSLRGFPSAKNAGGVVVGAVVAAAAGCEDYYGYGRTRAAAGCEPGQGVVPKDPLSGCRAYLMRRCAGGDPLGVWRSAATS
uniref:Uncharacterized protein n=1 Tax=Oryza barthii TaxID=65489 RepID=A0A0D3HMS6_9ORYZ